MMEELIKALTDRLSKMEELTLLATKPILTVEDASNFTGLAIATIHKCTMNRTIPFYKSGNTRRVYFKRKELEEWMTRNRFPELSMEEREAIAVVSKRKLRNKD